MHARVHKWLKSLGVRIPAKITKQLYLYKIENGRLVVQPPRYNLHELLKQITTKNKHHLLLEDTFIGEEEW